MVFSYQKLLALWRAPSIQLASYLCFFFFLVKVGGIVENTHFNLMNQPFHVHVMHSVTDIHT